MSYSKDDLEMANQQLQQHLVITDDDLHRLEARVLRTIEQRRRTTTARRTWTIATLATATVAFTTTAAVLLSISPTSTWDWLRSDSDAPNAVRGTATTPGTTSTSSTTPAPSAQPTRSAYIIWQGSYYVPTDDYASPEQIGPELGTIQRIGDWALKRDGDSNAYPPQFNKLFELVGVAPAERLVFTAMGNSAETPAYQIFRNDGPVDNEAAKTQLLSAKNDPEEVAAAMQNVRDIAPDIHELHLPDRAIQTFIRYEPDTHTSTLYYRLREADRTDQPHPQQGFLFITQTYTDQPSTLTPSFTLNGIDWQATNATTYHGRKGPLTFTLRLQGPLPLPSLHQLLTTFHPHTP